MKYVKRHFRQAAAPNNVQLIQLQIFHRMSFISTPENLLDPLAFSEIGSIFNSTEERSSSRREQTRRHQENRQRISRSSRATGGFGWNRESSYNERNDGRVREARAARFAGLERF
jgi:hypothetical protein